MSIKRYLIFGLFFVLSLYASAEQPRISIDSMQVAIRTFRDSVRKDIRDYRDSIRNIRRHTNDTIPHELRVGWGDQMFETLMWHDIGHPSILSPTYQATYNERFRYTQHWFAEYLYRLNYRYSFGLLMDYSGVFWDRVLRNGRGKVLQRKMNRAFHNIAIVPTVRFSYHRWDYVSFYSAIGVGLNINTGTEAREEKHRPLHRKSD